jgi:uncharacterized protein (DUF4415 family)
LKQASRVFGRSESDDSQGPRDRRRAALARDRCCVRNAVLFVVQVYREENPMAKKLSASSRRGKPIRVNAESIWNKPLTKRQNTALESVARRQKRADTSQIDYSDIPVLTDKQLTQFRRPPKKLVAVRLDADVFEWLRQYGAGYSTRINHVLRLVMSHGRQT